MTPTLTTAAWRIRGLSPAPWRDWFALADEELAQLGARRVVADAQPGYPDRVTLRDAAPGETLILANHCSVERGPFRATHGIYLSARDDRFDAEGTVPPMLRGRLLSLRAFDRDDMLLAADVVDGEQVEPLIERLLADPEVAFVNVHFAKQGCFACKVERVDRAGFSAA